MPTAEPDEDDQNAFMVTRDMRLLRDTVVPKDTIGSTGDQVRILRTTTSTGGWMDDTGQIETTSSPEKNKNIKNLHEMTVYVELLFTILQKVQIWKPSWHLHAYNAFVV